MKLGRLAAQFDPLVPKLGNLIKAPSPLPDTEFRYRQVQYWPMLLNDQVGDCTVAGIGHIWEYWRMIATKSPYVMTDLEALAHYSAIVGYDPKNPNTDTGAVELDVLNYFKNVTMIASQPVQLLRFIAISSLAIDDVRYSIHNLGNCYIGINMPDSAMNFNTWDVVPGAKIIGGHCVNVVGFDHPNQLLFVVSWGQVIPMTYNFFQTYCEEAWSLYSLDWVQAVGASLSTFDHQTIINS